MDKEYYKSLPTHAEKCEYACQVRKERKQKWDEANADKVFQYRRATTLRRCEQRCSVPTKQTIKKYNFTKDELRPIFDALWTKWNETLTDTEDSVEADSE